MKCLVKELRENHEVSQQSLAEACKVSRQTIYAIENGTFSPSVVLALKIAKFFKMPVEQIFVLEKGDHQ